MLKRFIRWILPLMVLVLIATYFVMSPHIVSHAAESHGSSIHFVAPNYFMPELYWRH